MIKPETPEPEKKKGLLDRLPRLGKTSQLILVVGIFLLLFIPLGFLYLQQPAEQDQLKGTLANLEKILAAPTTKKEMLESQVKQAESDLTKAKAVFPQPDQSPEIIAGLLELAKANGITVTRTKVSISKQSTTIGKSKIEYPLLIFDISLKGQVPKFQNFLLALDTKFPTCQMKKVNFAIAAREGDEDTASMTINVLCNEGSE